MGEESSRKINEIIKLISGDEDEEEDEEAKKNSLAGLCINKRINILINKFNELYNKIIAVQNKNNALTREIKEEVKHNLKAETIKVVEEFKSKLDSFTNKFENELRMKIDHGGLSVFEDKMSSKFRVKTNAQNVELCASCNQTLKKSFGNTERNFYSRNGELNSVGHKKSLKSNSNHHINLNMNSKDINTNLKNNKKLPGIISYTQAK